MKNLIFLLANLLMVVLSIAGLVNPYISMINCFVCGILVKAIFE